MARALVGWLLAGLLLIPAVAGAETVALFPATGLNVHEGYLAAAQDVMRGALERTGRFQVTMVPGKPGAEEVAPAQVLATARALKADLAVTVRITRLGNVARARLAAWRVENGALLHTDELAAATPDDLDPVLQRLAAGLAAGKPARDTAEIETVTQKEAEAYAKVKATNTFGLRLGGIFPMNAAGSTAEKALPGGGIFWLYDARSFLADVSVDLHGAGDSIAFGVGLGAYVPFSRANVAPYLGGGLRWSATRFGSEAEVEGGNGIAVFGAGGVLIGRLTTVQVRLEAGWFLNLYSHKTKTVPAPAGEHLCHGPTLSAGLGF